MTAHCQSGDYSGVHSMYGDPPATDDEDDCYKPAICRYCGEICFFDFACYWWTTRPYTIHEPPY